MIEDYKVELTIGEADVLRNAALMIRDQMLRRQIRASSIHYPLLLTALASIENQFIELREKDLATIN